MDVAYVEGRLQEGSNTISFDGTQITVDQIFFWRPEFSGAWGSQARASGDGWNVTIGHTLIDFTKKANQESGNNGDNNE